MISFIYFILILFAFHFSFLRMTFDRRYIIKFRFSSNSSLIICKTRFFLSGSSAKFPGLGHQVQVRKRKGGEKDTLSQFFIYFRADVPGDRVGGILAFFFWKEAFSFIYNRFFEFLFWNRNRVMRFVAFVLHMDTLIFSFYPSGRSQGHFVFVKEKT